MFLPGDGHLTCPTLPWTSTTTGLPKGGAFSGAGSEGPGRCQSQAPRFTSNSLPALPWAVPSPTGPGLVGWTSRQLSSGLEDTFIPPPHTSRPCLRGSGHQDANTGAGTNTHNTCALRGRAEPGGPDHKAGGRTRPQPMPTVYLLSLQHGRRENWQGSLRTEKLVCQVRVRVPWPLQASTCFCGTCGGPRCRGRVSQ